MPTNAQFNEDRFSKEKSLIFISKLAILGSLRGGSVEAFVARIFLLQALAADGTLGTQVVGKVSALDVQEHAEE